MNVDQVLNSDQIESPSNEAVRRSPTGRVMPLAVFLQQGNPSQLELYFWTPSDAHEFLVSQTNHDNFRAFSVGFFIEYCSWEGRPACRLVTDAQVYLRL